MSETTVKEFEQACLKHLQGKHNQKRHGWRYTGDAVANARSAMRGQDAGERGEYRKRAGMAEPKKVEKKTTAKKAPPKLVPLKGTEKQIKWAEQIRDRQLKEVGELAPTASEGWKKTARYMTRIQNASWWISHKSGHGQQTLFMLAAKHPEFFSPDDESYKKFLVNWRKPFNQ